MIVHVCVCVCKFACDCWVRASARSHVFLGGLIVAGGWKKFNVAILVQILVYFWQCMAKTCHLGLLSHTQTHTQKHTQTNTHRHTHACASLPFNKSQTVPFPVFDGFAKPQWNRIPSNYNVGEPLPRLRIGSPLLPAPREPPYDR